MRLGPRAWLMVCLFFFCATSSFAQTLGEAARQERARKQNTPRRATRVYTEEDLTRPQILDRQDRARARNARRNWTPPASAETADSSVDSRPTAVPLGDSARYHRALNQNRRKQQQLALPPQMGAPVLASPKSPRPLPTSPTASRISGPDPSAISRKAPSVQIRKSDRSGDSSEAVAVRLRHGDTLWKLAKRNLGQGSRWIEVAAMNPPMADPRRIPAGAWVRLPPRRHTAPREQQLQVRKGDTLWKIGRARFGNGGAWKCIARANPLLISADRIYPGQILSLPADCAAEPATTTSNTKAVATARR